MVSQTSLPGTPGLMAQFADDAAIGIDFDAAGAGFAAHSRVEGLFDAALADAKTRQAEQRIVVAVHVFRRHRGDIAQDCTISSPKG